MRSGTQLSQPLRIFLLTLVRKLEMCIDYIFHLGIHCPINTQCRVTSMLLIFAWRDLQNYPFSRTLQRNCDSRRLSAFRQVQSNDKNEG